ncbi:hypothetical protein AVEN_23667-1 [Araneus ventricosus]|uniref:Uncharacterized protein n=1 Tax=Araneus ventricosus TaxID=182803 RepID=A0A4Y2BIR0_ARAVE|nr:hypothetical protein AVEN_23667-1 [Araneus ventricosus]
MLAKSYPSCCCLQQYGQSKPTYHLTSNIFEELLRYLKEEDASIQTKVYEAIAKGNKIAEEVQAHNIWECHHIPLSIFFPRADCRSFGRFNLYKAIEKSRISGEWNTIRNLPTVNNH